MLNLLLKDLWLLRKNAWVPVLYSFMIFFLFGRTDSSQMIYVMGINMIAYLMIMYSTAYDDMNKSDVMLNSLPLRRKDIVTERYLSLFVFVLMTALLMAASGVVMTFLKVFDGVRLITFSDVAIAACSISLIVFLYLPVYFKLGYVKAKLFNFAIFFAVFLLPTLLMKALVGTGSPAWAENLDSVSETSVILFMGVLATVVGAVSYALSLRFYARREF